MITFRRRNVGCWDVCDDIKNRLQDIPLLEFDNVDDLFDYIRETLPFVKDEKDYKLRLNKESTAVVWWSVLGFIVT